MTIHFPRVCASDLSTIIAPFGLYSTSPPRPLQALGLGQPLIDVNTNLSDPLISIGPPLYTGSHFALPQLVLSGEQTLSASDLSTLQQKLFPILAPFTMGYGTLIVLEGKGVFITGEPGVGKSRLAWHALQRGHQLVADDAVRLSYQNGKWIGWSAQCIKNKMHLRGKGFKNIQDIFTPFSVKDFAVLDFVCTLYTATSAVNTSSNISSLACANLYSSANLKKMFFSVESFRNLIILVENRVRLLYNNQSTGSSE